MILRTTTMNACLAVTMSLACATQAQAQAGAETFTATAKVKTVGGAEATAPVTITIDRKMPEAGVPGAKPKVGYDFAVVDLELDARGDGSGTLAPAAKVTVKGSEFVVDDYASELVLLTSVKKVK